ncbi:MAG: hypothetical protein ACFFD7_13485 [Candidatus Thorarchaeota archaeon]
MIEFRVNQFITLKLEEGETNIYVNNKLFNQCKFVIINRIVEDVEDLLELESVDELLAQSDQDVDLEYERFSISAEAKFWAHCSNIQTWYENNYDTRLLHSNLSFPLLKKLYAAGDIVAKRVFKEEIAKRLKYGSYWVQKYLFIEGYTSFLSREELINGVLVPEEANALMEISRITRQNYNMIPSFDDDEFRHRANYGFYFSVKDGHVIGFELVINKPHAYIPTEILNFTELQIFYIYIGLTEEVIPIFNVNLESLRILKIITQGDVILPDAFDNFPNLVYLTIHEEGNGPTSFERMPETIGCLKHLSRLEINNISLKTLPSNIDNLKMLDILKIRNTGLESLPNSIYNLNYLSRVVIEGNPLKLTPKIRELTKRFEDRIYSLIKERTIEGFSTGVSDLKDIFKVPEYKIYNSLYNLLKTSRIQELDELNEIYKAN